MGWAQEPNTVIGPIEPGEPRAVSEAKATGKGDGGESKLSVGRNNSFPENPEDMHAGDAPCGEGGSKPDWIEGVAAGEDAGASGETTSLSETSYPASRTVTTSVAVGP